MNTKKLLAITSFCLAVALHPLFAQAAAWQRLAHRVLDVVAEEGVRLDSAILCHMGPSWRDFDYQAGLAQRGAYLDSVSY